MSFKMKGVSEMVKKIVAIKEKFPDKVAAAIYQEGQVEMTESKRRVPVDTGALRATGQVSEPEREGKKISVTLSFGTDYAIIVHENLEANHPRGGQAKYLESVLKESAPYMADRIARRLGRLDK